MEPTHYACDKSGEFQVFSQNDTKILKEIASFQ